MKATTRYARQMAAKKKAPAKKTAANRKATTGPAKRGQDAPAKAAPTASRKATRSRAAAKRGSAETIDPRTVFRRMVDGELVYGIATDAELQALKNHPDAWDVFLAFIGVAARRRESDQRLIRKLRSQVDKHFGLQERQRRFLGVVQRAGEAFRSGDADRAVDAVCAQIDVEQQHATVSRPRFKKWPFDGVRERLAKYRPPDKSKAEDRRGGHGAYGEAPVAAELAFGFRILGWKPDKTLEDMKSDFVRIRGKLKKSQKS